MVFLKSVYKDKPLIIDLWSFGLLFFRFFLVQNSSPVAVLIVLGITSLFTSLGIGVLSRGYAGVVVYLVYIGRILVIFGYMVILGPNVESTTLWMTIDVPFHWGLFVVLSALFDLLLRKFLFCCLEGNEIAFNPGKEWFRYPVERTRTLWILGGSLMVFGFFMFYSLSCVTKL